VHACACVYYLIVARNQNPSRHVVNATPVLFVQFHFPELKLNAARMSVLSFKTISDARDNIFRPPIALHSLSVYPSRWTIYLPGWTIYCVKDRGASQKWNRINNYPGARHSSITADDGHSYRPDNAIHNTWRTSIVNVNYSARWARGAGVRVTTTVISSVIRAAFCAVSTGATSVARVEVILYATRRRARPGCGGGGGGGGDGDGIYFGFTARTLIRTLVPLTSPPPALRPRLTV